MTDDAVPDAPTSWRELAVARSLDPARVRAEKRVQRFLDAALELMTRLGREGVHRPGGRRTLRPVAAELLPVLRRQARAAAGAVRGVGPLDRRAPRRGRRSGGRSARRGSSVFTSEYYRMCRPATSRRDAKPEATTASVMADFAQQLLTQHPQEAAQAFVPLVSILERLLDEAAAAGRHPQRASTTVGSPAWCSRRSCSTRSPTRSAVARCDRMPATPPTACGNCSSTASAPAHAPDAPPTPPTEPDVPATSMAHHGPLMSRLAGTSAPATFVLTTGRSRHDSRGRRVAFEGVRSARDLSVGRATVTLPIRKSRSLMEGACDRPRGPQPGDEPMSTTGEQRQMSLVASCRPATPPCTRARGAIPATEHGFLDQRYYQKLGRTLEEGCFDMMFFDDRLAMPGIYGGSVAEAVRLGARPVKLDLSIVLGLIAGVTRSIGLGRDLLDDLLLAVPRRPDLRHARPPDRRPRRLERGHVGQRRRGPELRRRRAPRPRRPLRPGRRVPRGHDRALGHVGGRRPHPRPRPAASSPTPTRSTSSATTATGSDVRGPLTVPRSPQGRPVLLQAGSSGRGRDFAARWAELIFTGDPGIEIARNHYKDQKDRIAEFGRDPSRCACCRWPTRWWASPGPTPRSASSCSSTTWSIPRPR